VHGGRDVGGGCGVGEGSGRRRALEGKSMKIYKVISMVVDYGRSLTPALGDPVSTPSPADLAAMPGYREAWELLHTAGYGDRQTMIIMQAWFTHAHYSMGLSASESWLVVRNTVMVYVPDRPPPMLPPVVYYVLAVVGIVLITKALIDPMDYMEMTIQAPSTMYCFANEDAIWYGELVAVSARNRGLYEICGEVGGLANALAKNVPYPPDTLDQLWFLGSVLWEGWMFPYFRRYYHRFWWIEYLDVALHQNQANYYLKHNAYDPFLPRAPYIRPGTQFGTPGYTGIYVDWWRSVVP